MKRTRRDAPALGRTSARDVRQSLPRDVRQSLPRDVRQSLPRDVRQSLPRDVRQSLPRDVRQSLPRDVRQSLSRRALSRVLFTFLASLVALGHFAAISHAAFVAHAICAEHGELVHVERGPGTTLLRAVEAAEAAPRVLSIEAHPEEDHDHCLLGVAPPSEGTTSRSVPRTLVPPDPPVVPVLEAPEWAPEPIPLAPAIAILLLSPKGSPPA